MMGITGGVAGQMFGLLVGFSISIIKKILTEGKSIHFSLFDYS